MNKFKIGDRVRRINQDHRRGEFRVGMEGMITSIKGDNRYVIDDHPIESHDPNYLEVVPSDADIDREIMNNSEMDVFAKMVLHDVGKRTAYYDAAQLRSAFRAGYDYAVRSDAHALPNPPLSKAQKDISDE